MTRCCHDNATLLSIKKMFHDDFQMSFLLYARMMGRRKDLGLKERYCYHFNHFVDRINTRYGGLTFDETDYLALHRCIHHSTPAARQLAQNKDGTLIIVVR
jgi:hypothetical protein